MIGYLVREWLWGNSKGLFLQASATAILVYDIRLNRASFYFFFIFLNCEICFDY